MTTNPDGDGKREEACAKCGGWGWYVTGQSDNPIQVQCDACSGTGLAPQFLVQHPDFKR